MTKRYLVAAALALAGCGGDDPTVAPDDCVFREAIDDVPTPPTHTPRWAFEPWISKDSSTTDDMYDFVAGFRSRDIPVGVAVLDSPWEVNYNDLTPNPARYPNFETLVSDLRADDIRLVLWITQMVNKTSFDLEPEGDTYAGSASNFEQGLDCGFYIDDGRSWGWWKGVGGAVDFFHPEAVAWWHRLQDPLLEMGVAGFKLDFGDSYVRADSVTTHAGVVEHQAYSEAYYEDFFRYGAAKVGLEEFVTMVRPYDESYDFEGRFYARPEHAPVGWVGDNRRDWVGMSDALDHIFRSAVAGYAVVGSDLGGYLDVDDKNVTEHIPFDLTVFQRWTALSALTPFMQLHGRANLAPWTVPESPDQTVAIYRYWAKLHHELVPFFFSLAEQAYVGGEPILRPLGDAASWPGDYRYMLGEALLVAPLLDASGVRDVTLPAGQWYDWWQPGDDPLAGDQTLSAYDVADPARIPLFVKRGAIVPLADAGEVTGLGTAASATLRTVLVYPDTAPTSFALHDDDDALTTLSASSDATGSHITLSRAPSTTVLRVRADSMASGVDANGSALTQQLDRAAFDAASSAWYADPAARSVWIKLEPQAGEVTVNVTP